MEQTIGVWCEVVDRLTPVPQSMRLGFLDLPPTREAHAAAYADVAALRQIEVRRSAKGHRTHLSPALSATSGGEGVMAPHGSAQGTVRIAAWNLERCLYPEEAARILQRNRVDLALLTEMDVGVLRTGQVHTIGRLAAELGKSYCYALEFLELVPMSPPPGFPSNGDANVEGFHGNGIIASLPFENPVVIRLDEMADWFTVPMGSQRRIGNRMAVAATISAGTSRFVACSVHLENRTDGNGRAMQSIARGDRRRFEHTCRPWRSRRCARAVVRHGGGARLRLGRVQSGATDDADQHLESKRGDASTRLVLHAGRQAA
jgi:endonuclease/exonuclease/phosphatase family metal-dependent hydrolase